MKILFIDTETGGLNAKKSALIQLSGIVRTDKKDVEQFNFFIKPPKDLEISEEALAVQGRKLEDLENFDDEEVVFEKFLKLLNRYINPYDKDDKFVVAGYNVGFDVRFLEEFFTRHNNKFLYSYIGRRNLDPLDYILFLQMCGKLPYLENNKLGTWCEYFSIPLDAHDSFNDIVATKKLIFETVKIIK